MEFALYCLVAGKRSEADCSAECPGCVTCTVGAADFSDPDTIAAFQRIAVALGLRDPRLQELRWWAKDEAGKERFLQVCARIKRKIRRTLGEGNTLYTIAPLATCHGRSARSTISLSKSLIQFS